MGCRFRQGFSREGTDSVTGLLGPKGQPISSADFQNKKVAPPALGQKYGSWAGDSVPMLTLPGGGAIQFNLDNLTLDDFRSMRDHYQINSSLAVLTFLMHQMEWKIVCEDKKQQTQYQDNMELIWTDLVRALSQAFWAGYSPNVIDWENNTQNRSIDIDKVRDLRPEDCHVKWKKIDGATVNGATHKISVYDGIHQIGSPDIPVENSFWYPLLMENGNYYGKKLLRSAFQPWFFSILLHLFANRYYERFGEPTPVGRAPYDDEVRFQGQEMRGDEAMELILQSLRSRATVVLPNDKTPVGNETNPDFDYQIEYLESQMRGADFERYMTRLDEEMSLALFTPILLMRTADVGSYNLGTQHSIIYQWMLNAIAGDWKKYIDKYLLRPMRDYNYGVNAPLPRIQFRRMGAQNQELINALVTAMVTKGTIKPDINQLGEMAGLTLKQVRAVTTPPAPAADPNADPAADPNASDGASAASVGSGDPGNKRGVRAVAERISERVADQVRNGLRKKTLESTTFSIGFNKQFQLALEEVGHAFPEAATRDFYARLQALLQDMAAFADEYRSAEQFMLAFREVMFAEIDMMMEY